MKSGLYIISRIASIAVYDFSDPSDLVETSTNDSGDLKDQARWNRSMRYLNDPDRCDR